LITPFIDYAAQRGVLGRPEFIKGSFPLVITQLKAYIARNMLGEDAFWKILQEDDVTLTKGVEVAIRTKGANVLNK